MKKYYFIGIGGIGMSGLAKILLVRGNNISGSDLVKNKETEILSKLGAKINYTQVAENISKELETVVITSAIRDDNPELVKAKELGLKIITRSELLNAIITEHKALAVTGTHGKTTTSSMIATILEVSGLDPTAVIGAEVNTISGNAKNGNGEYSIAEVCEYQRAFLDIYPYAAVITNIEEDHLDCYKDINDIIKAFAQFTTHIDKNGFLVVFGNDRNIQRATKNYKGKLITYGLYHQRDYVAEGIEVSGHKTSFKVSAYGKSLGQFEIFVPGSHNVLDALAAIAMTNEIGVDKSSIKKALAEFRGADRRFQLKGEKDGVIYIDDYAHHPTEITATLAGARQFYPDKRIIAVFQPHQHSRTKLLMQEFAQSFSNADLVVVPEIYAVRDTKEDIEKVSSKQLVKEINQYEEKEKAFYFKTFDEATGFLGSITREGDLVLTIGAGPVNQIGERILLEKSVEKSGLE